MSSAERDPDAGSVLVIDDDEDLQALYRAFLEAERFDVLPAISASQAHAILEETGGGVDAAVLDISLGDSSGLDLLAQIHNKYADIPVVMSTVSKKVDDAIFALKNGAFDYLLKPVDREQLVLAVRKAVEKGQMARELGVRRALDPSSTKAGDFVFASSAMRNLLGVIENVKDSSVPVLILGETGTGKEVVARQLHYRSRRHEEPFVTVNCATLPRELVESELFGHKEGAFTGASSDRDGKFQEAHQGTLFLDEVGELEPDIQAKLLRVLQENEVTPVGGRAFTIDTRVVVATNRDLPTEVRAGRFRDDLYFRLNVITVKVPPLSARTEEIPLLAGRLLERFVRQDGLPQKSLSEQTMEALKERRWPGNVRELENVLKRAALLSKGEVIRPGDLAPPDDGAPPPQEARAATTGRQSDEEMRAVMMRALAEHHGNVSAAARYLGIGRATFYRRAKKLQIPL